MNSERVELLDAWRDAARIERDALMDTRDRIVSFLRDCDAGDYPRMEALETQIDLLERSIAQQEARIVSAAFSDTPGVEPTRLTQLLRWQDDAREDRAALVEARDDLPIDSEDERFSALTREIAEVDEEILARAQEIETLAALARV